jgi:glycosyltransferase involved in cell wall biosynthesis
VLLGDGPERVRLEAMARRLKVDLRLPGFVPRNEVGRWMAAADLYVQPSRRLTTGRTEGLPTATLEALASGLPVVASATGGLAELPGVIQIPPADARILSAHLAFPCAPDVAARNPKNVSTA